MRKFQTSHFRNWRSVSKLYDEINVGNLFLQQTYFQHHIFKRPDEGLM